MLLETFEQYQFARYNAKNYSANVQRNQISPLSSPMSMSGLDLVPFSPVFRPVVEISQGHDFDENPLIQSK